jgi:hypothetical protein
MGRRLKMGLIALFLLAALVMATWHEGTEAPCTTHPSFLERATVFDCASH